MNDQVTHWDRLSIHPIDASVLDPNDRRGHKNRYITELRNQAIVRALQPTVSTSPVLDFGCGTGGVSSAIENSGRMVVGVDISAGLLRRTSERNCKDGVLFLQYDGTRLPIQNESIAAAVTYVVLNHILDDAQLLFAIAEIRRVLKPGGRFIAIEQVRSRQTLDEIVWQRRRTISEFESLFTAVGFVVSATQIIRYGHSPVIYAVQCGLLPHPLYNRLFQLERTLGRWLGVMPWDYSDVMFPLKK